MSDCGRNISITCPLRSHFQGGNFRGLSRGRGFTLIELLAVIVIISLVSGVMAGSFAAMNESQMFSAAAARVRDLDARARLLGRTGEPAMMVTTSERDGLVLHAEGRGELVSSVEMPEGVRVHLVLVRGGGKAVSFDTFGRSGDYAFTLVDADSISTWVVSGLTGSIERREDGR